MKEILLERLPHPPCELKMKKGNSLMSSASTVFRQNPHPFPYAANMYEGPTV